jgi:hypothetical protein
VLAREGVHLLDLLRIEVRVADVADLRLAHQLVQCTEGLLERRDVIRGVVLVEIDVVGA